MIDEKLKMGQKYDREEIVKLLSNGDCNIQKALIQLVLITAPYDFLFLNFLKRISIGEIMVLFENCKYETENIRKAILEMVQNSSQ